MCVGCEAVTKSDCVQEVSELQQEVSQLWDQLNQQSEFSSSLGAATATLLWRVSRNQDTIAALLGGVRIYRETQTKKKILLN
jgi:hypothetical protein